MSSDDDVEQLAGKPFSFFVVAALCPGGEMGSLCSGLDGLILNNNSGAILSDEGRRFRAIRRNNVDLWSLTKNCGGYRGDATWRRDVVARSQNCVPHKRRGTT